MVSSNIKIEKGALELEDGQLTDKWSQTGYALVKSGIIQDIIDFKLRNNNGWGGSSTPTQTVGSLCMKHGLKTKSKKTQRWNA